MDSELLLLILLIILSGAFSGAEIALTTLNPAKVQTIKDDKKFASRAIYKLKKKPESLLITILVGNNLVNILASVLATLWAVKILGDHAIGVVTGVLTFIVLIFGEITPKTLAQKYAETFSRIMAYPLLWLTYLIFPIVWLLNQFIHGLMKLLKAKSPITMSEEELLAMVDIGTQEGVIEAQEQELIENVLEFTDTTVEEIMTISSKIECLELGTTIRDAGNYFTTHSHSRIPVYKKTIDNVMGILTVHDILKIMHKQNGEKTLEDIEFSHPIVVPKTKSISKLFHEFKKRRQHMAIVVDDRGHTIGLVTMEDILEEIVGDIVDEQDKEEKRIHAIGKNEWLAIGETTIEEINEIMDEDIDYPEHQTVSLLILEQLQRFPKLGEKIQYENLVIQVRKMSKKKIEEVHLTRLQQNKDEEE